MKKVLILCLLILISCSKSDFEEDPREAYFREAIIGSWSINTITVDGQTFLYKHTENCEKDLFQFYNEEGKEFDFEETVVLNCSNCAPCATSGTNLKWELEGDIINLYFGDQLILNYKIIEVTENIFIYEVVIDYDNDGEKETLQIKADKYDPYNDFS